ncbi:MAG TPA: hypothetical protein ENI60_06165 [Candidatus Fraserbacteria bacterium]|nr:hypothetical protein [Candidatus Fraserbacteria bacterium]
MIKLSPAVLGGLIAMALGLVGLFLGWGKLFILLALGLLGYGVGKLLESGELRDKLREIFSLFR